MFKNATNKFLAIAIAVFILLSSVPVISTSAEAYQKITEQGIYYEINNEEVTITGCAENVKDVVIPQTIEGYPVTSIGYRAFSAEMAYHSIESIEIPEGVIIIEDLAFECCMDLKSVTIPSTLTHIGSGGFFGCNYIEKVYISDLSAWLNIETLDSPLNWENNAILYLNNEILTDVTIPNGITKIPDYAFSYTSLERITIPDSVTSIGNSAFSNCNNLSYVFFNGTEEQWNSITISPNENSCLTNADIYFEYYVFTDPYEPTDVYPTHWETDPYEPTDVYPTYWETDPYEPTDVYPTYWETDPYEPTDVYPTDVYETTIPITPDGFLYEITNTEAVIVDYFGNDKEVIIPNSINSCVVVGINPHAFEDQEKIKAVFIPDTVNSIGNSAFKNCTNLKSIIIPESVMYIDKDSFSDCINLKDIVISDKTKYISANAFNNTAFYNNINNWEDNVLYLGSLLIKANENISGAYEIRSSTTNIASGAFANCTKLESITIPNSITRIGMGTFSNCTSLKDITIPDSLTSIADDTFSSCTKLENVYISDIGAWVEIGYGSPDSNPLYYADNLYLNNELVSSIEIPEGAEYIGNYAFSCTNLENIAIPQSIKTIDISAFDNCKNLKNVYYIGTEEQWNEIEIFQNNAYLTNAVFHFESTLPTEVPKPVFEIGDVNGDMALNIKDVTAIQKHLAKLLDFDESQMILADFNKDDKINVKDATTIQKKLAGLEI